MLIKTEFRDSDHFSSNDRYTGWSMGCFPPSNNVSKPVYQSKKGASPMFNPRINLVLSSSFAWFRIDILKHPKEKTIFYSIRPL